VVSVRSGEEYRKTLAEFERLRAAEVARRAALLGAGDGGAGLFAPGASAELVGRRPESLPAAPRSAARVAVDDLPLLARVDPRAALLPALAGGTITGPLQPGTELALALNGRIAAVTSAYREDGRLRFSALLPPSAFRAGRNRLDVYAVTGSALAAIEGSAPAAPTGRLSGAGDDLRIGLPGGRSLPVEPGATDGFVEHARAPDAGHLEVEGWAIDPGARRSATRVLVFLDRRLLGSARPELPRDDVAADHGPGARLSGFRVAVARLGAPAAVPRLRVFAVSRGRASELDRLGG
jgi:hypothetical protein